MPLQSKPKAAPSAAFCSRHPARPPSRLSWRPLVARQAWDRTFSEVIRQVTVHLAERGALLQRLREVYLQWMRSLMLSNVELSQRVERLSGKERREKSHQVAGAPPNSCAVPC